MNNDVKKPVCFTGHRIIKESLDKEALKNVIEKLINDGYCVFLCGMAVGFDMLCFSLVLELKEKYGYIKIIACVPYSGQADNYGRKKKAEYEKYISVSDEVVTLYEKYNEACMKERNRYMVDNSSVCVSYLFRTGSGTYYTTRYAVEKGKTVIYIK